ncbi:hypothetical protein V8940_19815, partial [Acinetobacter pittii]|uniref:hypothetical protein n=1 Tax=Acinetobacter pittii TaxID=48296 RepID=UPI00300D295E
WADGDVRPFLYVIAMDPQDLSPVEAEVLRLRQMQQAGRHADVLPGAIVLLEQYPENRDLLLIVAASQRCLGQIAPALAALDRL